MNAQPATAAAAAGSSSLILQREDQGGIAILTLNRPQARNSLSEAMLEALGDALTAIAHERTVRVVVIAANGPAFSAGHDLKELNAHRTDDDRGRAYFKHIMALCSDDDAADRRRCRSRSSPRSRAPPRPRAASWWRVAISRSPRTPPNSPPPASISACSARRRWSRCRATYRAKHAMEMLLTGELISAEDAARIGLVNHVVAPGHERDGGAQARRKNRRQIGPDRQDRQGRRSTARSKCRSPRPTDTPPR